MMKRPASSARKNIDQRMPEYSTKGPPTTSDSPTGMSKGVRLSSAGAAMKKRKKASGRRPEHHFAPVQRPGDDADGEQRQHQRQLVGDRLGGGAQAADHRVAVVRAPSRCHPPDDRQRG